MQLSFSFFLAVLTVSFSRPLLWGARDLLFPQCVCVFMWLLLQLFSFASTTRQQLQKKRRWTATPPPKKKRRFLCTMPVFFFSFYVEQRVMLCHTTFLPPFLCRKNDFCSVQQQNRIAVDKQKRYQNAQRKIIRTHITSTGKKKLRQRFLFVFRLTDCDDHIFFFTSFLLPLLFVSRGAMRQRTSTAL